MGPQNAVTVPANSPVMIMIMRRDRGTETPNVAA